MEHSKIELAASKIMVATDSIREMLGDFMGAFRKLLLNFHSQSNTMHAGRFLRRGSWGKACLIYDGEDGK